MRWRSYQSYMNALCQYLIRIQAFCLVFMSREKNEFNLLHINREPSGWTTLAGDLRVVDRCSGSSIVALPWSSRLNAHRVSKCLIWLDSVRGALACIFSLMHVWEVGCSMECSLRPTFNFCLVELLCTMLLRVFFSSGGDCPTFFLFWSGYPPQVEPGFIKPRMIHECCWYPVMHLDVELTSDVNYKLVVSRHR